MALRPSSLADLLARFRDGKVPALARAISWVENEREGFQDLLDSVLHVGPRTRRIGFTGPPGAGKSSLLAGMAAAYRKRGEILGIVGVAGNGQKPLVETLCGLSRPEQGTVRILGQSWKDFFAHDVWAGALSYIPEDRQGLATCGNLDLVDNFLLTTRNGFTRGPWLQKDRAERKIAALALDFGIQPPDVKALARQLSGGNLQKMVLAREFFRRPRLIIAEQPTQGLDIAAIEDVWQLLLKAREKAGVLLVTGDLAEALALSDRIAVMFDGRIMDIFAPSDGPRLAQIGLLMAGIQPAAATEPGAVPPP